MKTSRLIGALSAIVFSCISMTAYAELQGRDLDGNPFTAEAYYDTDTNLTWLANASATGVMQWAAANTWAAGLNVGGVTGWRLPTSDGCTSFNCTGSEMGNMYHNVLGGSSNVGGGEISLHHNSNYYLFQGLQDAPYWAEAHNSLTFFAWVFAFNGGAQNYVNKTTFSNYAWPVHDGDVGAHAVASASEGLSALATLVLEMNLHAGISNAMDSKLSNALAAIDDDNDHNDGATLNMVYAFCNSTDAQRGKQLTDAQADELMAAANVIIPFLDEDAPPCE